jgi:hypothetical protein
MHWWHLDWRLLLLLVPLRWLRHLSRRRNLFEAAREMRVVCVRMRDLVAESRLTEVLAKITEAL